MPSRVSKPPKLPPLPGARGSKPPKPPPLPVARGSKHPKPPPLPGGRSSKAPPPRVSKPPMSKAPLKPSAQKPALPPELPPLPLVGAYAADPHPSLTNLAAVPRVEAPTPVSTLDKKGALSILVVEDDEATRRLMVRALRTQYTVFEATNGEEAASMLDLHPNIDCVLSDIMMPKLTGTELAQKMRLDVRLSRIPVVFVTAKKGAGEGIEAIKSGSKHYLRKPFKLRDLLDKVASVIEKPRSTSI
jgi:CheY-like chemotaxis protein